MSKHNGDRHLSDIEPEQLTAYALGHLRGEELAAVKAALGEGANVAAQSEVREVQALAAAISAAREAEPLPQPSVELRAAVEQKLKSLAVEGDIEKVALPERSFLRWPTAVECVVLGGMCCVVIGLLLPAVQSAREASRRSIAANNLRQLEIEEQHRVGSIPIDSTQDDASQPMRYQTHVASAAEGTSNSVHVGDRSGGGAKVDNRWDERGGTTLMVNPRIIIQEQEGQDFAKGAGPAARPMASASSSPRLPAPFDEPGGGAAYRSSLQGRQTQQGGQAKFYAGGAPGGAPEASGYGSLRNGFGYPGDVSGDGKFSSRISGMQNLAPGAAPGSTAPVSEPESTNENLRQGGLNYQLSQRKANGERAETTPKPFREIQDEVALGNTWEYKGYEGDKGRLYADGYSSGGEQYEPIVENQFLAPTTHPLSTFSIDVDTASYANVRRFLNGGQLPPPNAVRIEELVNYFTYSYPQPKGKEPFSVNMETAECPWNAGHLLLRVGLKGKEVHRTERPPSNLTFLLDVSGSMADENKLPLLKTTLLMFVAELTENDRVSIVTYAGDAGLRLPPTRGNEKQKIMAAIESLSSGGSTHGSAGIQLAYEQAAQYFLKEGTNRVILATDGDLNVGVTSDDALVQLIKEKATGGTFLTVLGFGTGNLKDGKLEKLADNGNGIYAYIDGVREGRKVLVEQMSGSLVTIAKDVKIQIEFNPAQIASYRLLGYENRVLAAEDFNNDKKDAGEIGAGHTVTALYELVPVGAKEAAAPAPGVEPLKYQATANAPADPRPPTPDSRLTDAAASGELLTLKLRYKEPDGIESRLLEVPLKDRGGSFHAASKDLQFAAAVASFGMILRGSEHRGSGNLPAVAEIASGAIGDDPSGYRAEFVDLVRKAQSLGAK